MLDGRLTLLELLLELHNERGLVRVLHKGLHEAVLDFTRQVGELRQLDDDTLRIESGFLCVCVNFLHFATVLFALASLDEATDDDYLFGVATQEHLDTAIDFLDGVNDTG